jgi:hypothetical protein
MVINIMKDGTIRRSMKGVKVTREQLPELYEVLQNIANRLVEEKEGEKK